MTVISEQEAEYLKIRSLAGLKPSHTPRCIVIAGGPGAGKSSFYRARKSMVLHNRDALHHSPDDIMLALSGYQADIESGTDRSLEQAFDTWELPARLLSESILECALEHKIDVVYDRSCALPSALEFMAKVKALGYELVIHGLHCDWVVAKERALHRQALEGRHIPIETLKDRHQSILQLWPQYFKISDQAFLYDAMQENWPLIASKQAPTASTEVLQKAVFESIFS